MTALAKVWTYADLLTLPENPGERHEIIAGELIVSASPMAIHQSVLNTITNTVTPFVIDNDLGEVLTSPIDVRLSEHNIFVPDLIFISHERGAILDFAERAVNGAPDLVVEISSPSTERYDRVQKLAAYADAGVLEYWLPSPMTRTFDMLTLENGIYQPIIAQDGHLASRVLPGLVIEIAAIFRRLDAWQRRHHGESVP